MNDEIKEILENIKRQNEWDEIEYFKTPLSTKDANKLLEYITNLQQEIQKKETMYDSLAVDYRLAQEENERLKEENKQIFSKVNDDELLISNAMNYAEAQDYKSRIEKAVEYINNYFVLGAGSDYQNNLLNILQNGSDEE